MKLLFEYQHRVILWKILTHPQCKDSHKAGISVIISVLLKLKHGIPNYKHIYSLKRDKNPIYDKDT